MFNPVNYIGIAAGAGIGAYTQDPLENPFSGVAGAGIGAIVGGIMERNLRSELGKFKPTKMNSSISSIQVGKLGTDPSDMISEFMEPYKRQIKPVGRFKQNDFTRTINRISASNKIVSTFNMKNRSIEDFWKTNPSEADLEMYVQRRIKQFNRVIKTLSEDGMIDELAKLRYEGTSDGRLRSPEAFKAHLVREKESLIRLVGEFRSSKDVGTDKIQRFTHRLDKHFNNNRWLMAVSNQNVARRGKGPRTIASAYRYHKRATAAYEEKVRTLKQNQLLVTENVNRYLSDIGEKHFRIGGDITPGDIDRAKQHALGAGYDPKLVRAANHRAATYNTSLAKGSISDTLMAGVIPAARQVEGGFKSHKNAYIQMFMQNGYSKKEAIAQAKLLAYATQHERVEVGSNFIELTDQKLKIPVTQIKDGVDVANVADLKNFSLDGNERFTVVRKGNIYGYAAINPEMDIPFVDMKGDRFKKIAARIGMNTKDAVSLKGYRPEQLAGLLAMTKEGRMTAKDWIEYKELIQPLYQNEADSSAIQARLISGQTDFSYSLFDDNGSIKLKKTGITPGKGETMSEMNKIANRFTAMDVNPYAGVSVNNVAIINPENILDTSSWLKAAEYNEGFTTLRKTRPLKANDYAAMYQWLSGNTKEDWRIKHSQATMKINISDELATAFSYKFGSQFNIDDGKAIAARELAYSQQKMRVTLGASKSSSGGYDIYSIFRDRSGNSLINDDFLKMDFKQQLETIGRETNLLKDGKLSFGADELIGTDVNGGEARIKKYVSKFNVEGFKLTKNGVEMFGTGVSEPGFWAKLFSTSSKAGVALADGKQMKEMASVAMAHAMGQLKLKDGRLTDELVEQAVRDFGDASADVGYITTFGESKMDSVQSILYGDKRKVAEYKTGGAKDIQKYIDDLSSTDRMKAANSQRMLDLMRLDYRQREEMLDTIGLMNYRKESRDKARADMMFIKDHVASNEANGVKAREMLFNMIGDTFGRTEDERYKQHLSLTRVTPEDLESIHGAGNSASASHLQRAQMEASGYTPEMIAKLYRQNLPALHEMQLMSNTGKTPAMINTADLTSHQLEGVVQAYGMKPEERAGFLKGRGINVADGTFTSFSTTSGNTIPMTFEPTNRSDVTLFGSGMQEYATEMEASRRRVMSSELAIREGGVNAFTTGSQSEALAALEDLYERRTPTIQKEWGKLAAKHGQLNIADSLGGEADDYINSLIGPKKQYRHGNVAFMSMEGFEKVQKDLGSKYRLSLEPATPYERATTSVNALEDIPKLFPTIKEVMIEEQDAQGNWGPKRRYQELYSREPAQGPHSAMVLDTLVDTSIGSGAGDHRFFSKHSEMINLLSKLDYDADTPAFASITGMDAAEQVKLKAIQEQTNRVGEEIMPLVSQLDAKFSTKDKPLDTLISAGRKFKDLEKIAKEKGTYRKEVAGLATKLNSEIGMALQHSNAGKDTLMTSRALLYGLTENMLKTSHKPTTTFEKERYDGIQDLMDMVSARIEGRESGVKGFEERFEAGIDRVFAMNEDRMSRLMADADSGFTQDHAKRYRESRRLIAESFNRALSRDPEQRVHPLLGSRQLGLENFEEVAASHKRYLESNIGRPLPDNRISYQETPAAPVAQRKAKVIDLGEAVSTAMKKSSKALAFGGAALAGFAILNAASPGDPPAASVKKNTVNAQPLQPRMDRKFYTRKIKQESLDMTVRGKTSNTLQQNKDAVIGKDAVVRADINIKKA